MEGEGRTCQCLNSNNNNVKTPIHTHPHPHSHPYASYTHYNNNHSNCVSNMSALSRGWDECLSIVIRWRQSTHLWHGPWCSNKIITLVNKTKCKNRTEWEYGNKSMVLWKKIRNFINWCIVLFICLSFINAAISLDFFFKEKLQWNSLVSKLFASFNVTVMVFNLHN